MPSLGVSSLGVSSLGLAGAAMRRRTVPLPAPRENQSGQAHQQTAATPAGRGVADGKARSTGVLLSSAGHCLVFRGFL
jgi:hypothetical protein